MGGLFSTEDKNRSSQRTQNHLHPNYPKPFVRSTTTNATAATSPNSNNNPYSHRIEYRSGQLEQSSGYRQLPELQYSSTRQSSAYNNYDHKAMNALNERLRELTIGGTTSRQVQRPVRSIRNPLLFGINSNFVVRCVELSEYDTEYMQINRMITNKRNFRVESIIKIENPYLERAYELKKEQKRQQYGHVEERLLFHGTKEANLDSILQNNFNWRLCKTHLFGKGVSFSPKATYAANYSDEHVYQKVMIVAKVLVSKSCIGNQFMELPVEGCDTSQKGIDGIVIVKYEDNEFYPAYKILYHLVNQNVGRKNNSRNRRGGRRQHPVHFNSFSYLDDSDEDLYYMYD